MLGLMLTRSRDINTMSQREQAEMSRLVMPMRLTTVSQADWSMEISSALSIEFHLVDVWMLHMGVVYGDM